MTRNLTSESLVRDVCRAAFRHKGKALLLFAIVMTGSVALAILLPRAYRSEGKLLVRLGRENAALEPTATLGHEQLITVPPSRENEVNSVVEVLTSRAIAEKTVAAIGEDNVLASKSWLDRVNPFGAADDRERAIQKLTKNLSVEPAPKSNIIRIAFLAGSPELSQNVVSSIIETFLQKHVELNHTAGASDFFEEQAARLRDELRDEEDRVRELKKDTGLISPHSQREALVERMTLLERDLSDAASQLAAEEAAVGNLKQQRVGLPETEVTDNTVGFSNEGTDFLRDKFYSLKVVEEGARAKYTENHPKMQEIRQQVEAARELLNREEPTRQRVTTAPSKLREQAERELLEGEPKLASLRAKADELTNQLAEMKERMKVFNDNEKLIADAEREIEILDAEYRKYSASLAEARIDQALQTQQMSNISIAEEPTFCPQPVKPRKLVILLAGLAVGLFGGLGLAIGADYLDRSLITPEDLEKNLDLPALETIPRIKSRNGAANGKK
jgi:polysaccharide biosynthesis protein PslE